MTSDAWTFAKCLAEFGITLVMKGDKLHSVEKVTDQNAIDFIKLNRDAIIEELRASEK